MTDDDFYTPDPRELEDGFDETDRRTRWRTFTSNYGRDFGWDVLVDGVPTLALVEPMWTGMFWTGYRVEPAGQGLMADGPLSTLEEWNAPNVAYRNRGTGEVVTCAFTGGSVPTEDSPYINMRSLYSRLSPSPLEWIRLWWTERSAASARAGELSLPDAGDRGTLMLNE